MLQKDSAHACAANHLPPPQLPLLMRHAMQAYTIHGTAAPVGKPHEHTNAYARPAAAHLAGLLHECCQVMVMVRCSKGAGVLGAQQLSSAAQGIYKAVGLSMLLAQPVLAPQADGSMHTCASGCSVQCPHGRMHACAPAATQYPVAVHAQTPEQGRAGQYPPLRHFSAGPVAHTPGRSGGRAAASLG